MLLLSLTVRNFLLWQWLGVGSFLLIMSIQDIRSRLISMKLCVLEIFLTLIVNFLIKGNRTELILGIIPGVLILICGLCSNQAIGYGDGFVIATLGLALGIEKVFVICVIAFLGAGIVALIMLVIRKVNKNAELPLVPFLLIGFVGVGLL